MPTYEYACSNCQNQWEEIQKISEPASTVCPKCTQATAKRQISGGNFILKGGGWYADLYSSTPTKKAEGSKANGTSSNGDSSKKADATPAASSSSNGSSGAGSQSSSSGSGSSGGGSSGSSSSSSSGS